VSGEAASSSATRYNAEVYLLAAFGSHAKQGIASLQLQTSRSTLQRQRYCVAAFVLYSQLLWLSVVLLMAAQVQHFVQTTAMRNVGHKAA
jgi:hypothetical protein